MHEVDDVRKKLYRHRNVAETDGNNNRRDKQLMDIKWTHGH